MQTKEVLIKNKSGLHARPASQLVHIASQFKAEINIVFEDKKINAKSIMGVMSLGISNGNKIQIEADGDDERKAVEKICDFIDKLPQHDKEC